MPAESKAQQHLMGMAYSVKTGEQKLADLPEGVREKVKGMLRSMSDKQLREFASTKTTSLPRRVGRRGPQTRVRRARAM